MALVDPLLKSLKYLVQEFLSVGEAVTETSPYLRQLCITLEQCFLKGMKKGTWGIVKGNQSARKRFWLILASFETDGPMPYAVSSAINKAMADKRIKTAEGKMRYLIRHCLVHQSLHVLVEFLMGKRQRVKEWYFTDQSSGKQAMNLMAQYGGGSSIIIHEELAEQLRSLLLTCSTSLNFELNLNNTYFLDESWEMPLTTTVEFVPTKELGIEMVYINGYAIVTGLKPCSLAADQPNLGIGDLLVEMNGKVLFPATLSGGHDAMNVWRHCRRHSLPCKLTVIKPRSAITGSIYAPLRNTLFEYHKWMERHQKQCQEKLDTKLIKQEKKKVKLLHPANSNDRTPVLNPEAAEEGAGGKFIVQYIGEVTTGTKGGVSEIEGVIRRALHKCTERTIFDVQITITEISVETETRHKNKPHAIFSHKYADIASCGKLVSDELHFCYIAGDTFCTLSKQFKGYVFRAESLLQARTILNAIYQGFQRTTWFM